MSKKPEKTKEEKPEAPEIKGSISTYITGVKQRHSNIPNTLVKSLEKSKNKCEAKRLVKEFLQSKAQQS